MHAAGVGASCEPLVAAAVGATNCPAPSVGATSCPPPAVGATSGKEAEAEAEPAEAEAVPARRGQAPRNEKKFVKNKFASARRYSGIGQSGCMPVSVWNFGSKSFSATLAMVFKLNLQVRKFLDILDGNCFTSILLSYFLFSVIRVLFHY
jgi:hypothetical protein